MVRMAFGKVEHPNETMNYIDLCRLIICTYSFVKDVKTIYVKNKFEK